MMRVSLLAAVGVAILAASAVTAQRLTRPAWPPQFTSEIDFSGTSWSRVAPREARFTLEADYERLALRLEEYGTQRWRAPINLIRPSSFSQADDNLTTTELYHFELSTDKRKCQYTAEYSNFDRIVGDFLDGSFWGAYDKNTPRMWFPSSMRPIALPDHLRSNERTRNGHGLGLTHLETTVLSSPVPFVSHWGNTWGSVDYCKKDWNHNPDNQTLFGCDALRVIMNRQSAYTHDLVHSVHRVHARARHSYDHDWEYRAKYDMKLQVAPDAFDLPPMWHMVCRNLEQRINLIPADSYHYVSASAPLLIRVVLARPAVYELGAVVVEIRHPDFVRVTPDRILFSAFDWDIPREVVFEAIGLGTGPVEFHGKGGGVDLPGFSTPYRSLFSIVARED